MIPDRNDRPRTRCAVDTEDLEGDQACPIGGAMDEHEPVGRRLERSREHGARLPIALDEVLGAVRAHAADPEVHLVGLASGGQ
jgi:hypothetical protein